MRNLIVGSVAALGLVAAFLATGSGRAQDKGATGATAAPPTLEAVIEHVMTHFAKADKGLRTGMKVQEAKKALAGSAHIIGTHVLPISSTPYGLPGVQGTVSIYSLSDEANETVGELHVAVLCGEFDRQKLAAKAVDVGMKLGFDMERDEDEDGVWAGSRENPTRSISVSLAGKGVILFELSGE